MRKTLFLTAAGISGLLALTAATGAMAEINLPDDGPQIELRDLVARVVVTPENRSDIDIKVRYGKAKVPVLMVSHRGNVTILNGHLDAPQHSFGFSFNIVNASTGGAPGSGRVFIPSLGNVSVDDLPLVFIRVPMNAAVKDSAYTFGHIGPSKSLEFVMNGGGDWLVDPVGGPLNVIASGSGDIRLSTAGDSIIDNMGSGDISIDGARALKVSLSGSGDFIANRSADTVLQNQGSGDVTLSHVNNLTVELNGSGDLNLGSINGGFSLTNNGSSDVRAAQVQGPVTLDLAGSGDVGIDGGQSPSFVLTGTGSGDVDFGGTTGTVSIDSNGSGDISIAKATGPVTSKVNGSGETHIGH